MTNPYRNHWISQRPVLAGRCSPPSCSQSIPRLSGQSVRGDQTYLLRSPDPRAMLSFDLFCFVYLLPEISDTLPTTVYNEDVHLHFWGYTIHISLHCQWSDTLKMHMKQILLRYNDSPLMQCSTIRHETMWCIAGHATNSNETWPRDLQTTSHWQKWSTGDEGVYLRNYLERGNQSKIIGHICK